MAKVDCTELEKAIADLALSIGAQDGIATLDDVVAEIQKSFPVMRREEIVNAIVNATGREARKTVELVERLNQIKQDARLEKETQERIAELQGYLQAGTLPEGKAQPEPKGGVLGSLRAIRDDLKRQIAKSEPAQKARTQKQIDALNERIAAGDFLLAPKPRELPQSKELERLAYQRDRLRKQVRATIQALKPKTIWAHIVDPFNAIRAVKTSFDFSAVFRQGGFIVFGHPVRAAKALPDMFKAFASDRVATKVNAEILNRPNAPLYARAKLYLAPTDGSEVLAAREEAFMTRLAENIPGVAASQRAYVTFLNVLRADSFDTMAATLAKNGEPTLQEAQAVATFINEATGRGSLGGLESAAVALNTVFFAPKYTVSRFQLLIGHPLWGGTNETRKLIAQEYGRYLIGLGTVLLLGFLAGGDTEDDPRSADFLKIRFGRTRLDPLSGIAQTLVLTSRVIVQTANQLGITDEPGFKSTTTGRERDLTAADIGRFLRGKLSPTFGIPIDVVMGKNVVGEEVTPGGALLNALVPLSFGDIYGTMKEQGMPEGAALSILSIFGMGLQTYGSKRTE